MGVPVVASPIGENKFIIENEIDGFLVPNEKGWIEKLSCLVENEGIREKMENIARKKIEEKYSTEVYADKLINVFKKM